MTELKEGQRMKYQKDGRIFEIAKISRDLVILQALDDATQVLTGKASLDSLFETVPPNRFRGERVPSQIGLHGIFGEQENRSRSLMQLK